MNFESIYNSRVYDFFPRAIDISDGREVPETSGFISNNLSSIWDDAETKARNSAEGYFVWALYRILHTHARDLKKNGSEELDLSRIEKNEIKEEYFKVIKEAEATNKKVFCCSMMASQFDWKCELHDSKFDCPDALVDTNEDGTEFKFIIHDGGASGIKFDYCPWCGQSLNNKLN